MRKDFTSKTVCFSSALIILLLLGCDISPLSRPNEIRPGLTITRAELGDDWPLTIDQGVIRCIGSGGIGEVYFVTPELTIYAINDKAIAKGNQADIRSAPFYTGRSLSPIIDRGLDLCK